MLALSIEFNVLTNFHFLLSHHFRHRHLSLGQLDSVAFYWICVHLSRSKKFWMIWVKYSRWPVRDACTHQPVTKFAVSRSCEMNSPKLIHFIWMLVRWRWHQLDRRYVVHVHEIVSPHCHRRRLWHVKIQRKHRYDNGHAARVDRVFCMHRTVKLPDRMAISRHWILPKRIRPNWIYVAYDAHSIRRYIIRRWTIRHRTRNCNCNGCMGIVDWIRERICGCCRLGNCCILSRLSPCCSIVTNMLNDIILDTPKILWGKWSPKSFISQQKVLTKRFSE